MKRIVSALAAIALALAVASPTAMAQVDPAALFRQWVDAENRGDVDEQVALLTDDAVLIVGGLCLTPCFGKDAIRRELERRKANNTRPTLLTQEVSGNLATNRFEVRFDSARRAGVERIVVVSTTEARGGKISALRARNDATDPQTAAFLRAQVATNFENALNAGNVGAATALFADDAVATSATGRLITGREGIRNFLRNLVAGNVRVETVGNRQVQGDKVTWTGRITSEDFFRTLGVLPLDISVEAVVQDGRLKSFAAPLTPESAARVQAAQAIATVRASGVELNAGNIGRTLELFAEDAVVTTAAGRVFAGRDEIRTFLHEAVSGNFQAEISVEPQAEGDRVTWVATITAFDPFERLGVLPIDNLAEAVVQAGRIKSLTLSLSEEDAARFQAAVAAAQRR